MKTVGVIGMGPAGLAVVKELKEAGFSVTGMDKHSRVGGRWSLEQSTDGVYDELFVNISKRNLAYSDFPWDETIPSGKEPPYAGIFPHHTEVANYLQAYAESNDLLPNIQLDTQVVKIDEKDGTWMVTTTKNGKESKNEFDAIVMCTGLFSKPSNPLVDFFQDFAGTVQHSSEVRSVKNYKGKHVLVIGSDISGSDMCNSLALYGDCASVTNSIRKAPIYTNKISSVSNQPVDDVLNIRLPAWLSRVVPNSVALKGLKSVFETEWPNQPPASVTGGLERPSDLSISGFSLTQDFVDQVEAGKIQIKPGLGSVSGNKVTFQDGTSAEFDSVICATGYEIDMSFLPEIVQDKVGHVNPYSGKKCVKLYKHTLVPGMSNLAFAGYVHNAGGHFPAAEMQARYIAATFADKVPRPSDSTLQSGVDAAVAFKAACPFNQYDSTTELCEAIGDELGVTPSFSQAFWSPKKYLFRPIYSCYYRTNPAVDGKEKAERFSKLFEEYLANPATPSASAS